MATCSSPNRARLKLLRRLQHGSNVRRSPLHGQSRLAFQRLTRGMQTSAAARLADRYLRSHLRLKALGCRSQNAAHHTEWHAHIRCNMHASQHFQTQKHVTSPRSPLLPYLDRDMHPRKSSVPLREEAVQHCGPGGSARNDDQPSADALPALGCNAKARTNERNHCNRTATWKNASSQAESASASSVLRLHLVFCPVLRRSSPWLRLLAHATISNATHQSLPQRPCSRFQNCGTSASHAPTSPLLWPASSSSAPAATCQMHASGSDLDTIVSVDAATMVSAERPDSTPLD